MFCPECKKRVHGTNEQCPHCGTRFYQVSQSSGSGTRSASNSDGYMIRNIKAAGREKIKAHLPYAVLADVFAVLMAYTWAGNGLYPVYLFFLLLFGAVGLYFSASLLLTLYVILRPLSAPVFKRLSQFGDPHKVCFIIEKEVNQAQKLYGANLITPRFLICRSKKYFQITPLEDIIWISSRHFARERSHQLVLTDYRLNRAVFSVESEDEAVKTLNILQNRCPEILTGNGLKYRKYIRRNADILHQKTRGSWIVPKEI